MRIKPDIFSAPAPRQRGLARAQLLEAAVEIFGAKGVAGARVRDIARAAGQNVAAIKYYFGGKEQLYRAVLEAIVREIRYRMGDVFSEIHALRERNEPDPAAAAALLHKFLRAVFLRVLSREEVLPMARLLVREQMQPTFGFQVLYDQGFRHMHEALCYLVGQVLRRDPRERETIVRTHALMGQVYFFAMTREAILRRLEWRSFEGHNGEFVAEILKDHVSLLLEGLATRSLSGRRK